MRSRGSGVYTSRSCSENILGGVWCAESPSSPTSDVVANTLKKKLRPRRHIPGVTDRIRWHSRPVDFYVVIYDTIDGSISPDPPIDAIPFPDLVSTEMAWSPQSTPAKSRNGSVAEEKPSCLHFLRGDVHAKTYMVRGADCPFHTQYMCSMSTRQVHNRCIELRRAPTCQLLAMKNSASLILTLA